MQKIETVTGGSLWVIEWFTNSEKFDMENLHK